MQRRKGSFMETLLSLTHVDTVFKITSFTRNTRGNKKLLTALKSSRFVGPPGGRKIKVNDVYALDSKTYLMQVPSQDGT